MNDSRLPFNIVKGPEAAIKASDPTKGYVWFALDTRKIYYSDGTDFISMGGNSSVFFGTLTWPEDSPPDTDQVEFDFTMNEIEGTAMPNINDLILNSDGCFYRVVNITDNVINTIKLTIAGSGGTGGGGGSTTGSILTITAPSASKYFLETETNPEFTFAVHSTMEENNQIIRITYTLGSQTFVDDEPHSFGTITLDLTKYFNRISENGTNLSFVIEDVQGARKTSITYNLRKVRLFIEADSTSASNILQAANKKIQYRVIPRGTSFINDIKLIYSIFVEGSLDPIATFEKSVASLTGSVISQDIDFSTIDTINNGLGAYRLNVICTGTAGGQPISSNILNHSVISYDENPILVAYLPTTELNQYEGIDLSYEIAKSVLDNQKARITFIVDDEETVQEVEYNNIYQFNIYFETSGWHRVEIKDSFGHSQTFNNIYVKPYDGSMQVIDNNDIDLMLNLTTRGRNNNEILASRLQWIDKNRNHTATLSNFVWGNVNGWLMDDEGVNVLRLSSGASLLVNDYEPFGLDANNKEGMETGKTIELDFTVSNVTDYSIPLITCLSYTGNNDILCGFHVTGESATFNTRNIKATGGTIREGDSSQDQAYNTQIQGLTAKFAEGERIHLTWVIQKKTERYPMIKTYINGIVSGITQYTGGSDASSDSIAQNETEGIEPALIKVNSTAATIDLYNIRIFNKDLSDRQVLENYIATLGTIEERTACYNSNIGLLDSQGKISVTNIENGNYVMKLPYIKFTGGGQCRKDDAGYWLTNADGTNHLPRAKKDFRLVNHFDYVDPIHPERNVDLYSEVSTDPSKLNLINGVVMYGQGTSSMEYPVKNLRIKFKMKKDGKKVKFQVNSNDYPVDILTLKADYMESASAHNTGTANFVFDALEALGFHTPGQTYWNAQHPEYKTLTAIRGYPIICFFRPDEDSDFEFIGRYNLNMDKSSEEAFGFLPVPEEETDISIDGSNIEFGWIKNEGIQSGTNLDPAEHSYVNAIHCYEFLNNASNLDNFICPDKYRIANRNTENSILDHFDINETYYTKDSNDNYTVVTNPVEEDFATYYIKQSFEKLFYQNEKNEDQKIVPNWLTSFESRYPEDSMDVEAFYQMCAWLNSTNPDEATGDLLSTPKTYGTTEYTIDNRDYRLAKFTYEFEDHFNKNFVLFYYVLTHVLLMIDSRAKNMMMATWDNQHWYPIFYDMDTMLGLNNYGYNKFDYNVEDKDANVFNGQASVLWNNLKLCFESDIRAMYDDLQDNGGLTQGNLLNNYNTIQADMWNEIMYNYDATYKYITPYAEGYYDGKNLGDDGKPVKIPAGTKNYLYAAQGSRSMHRRYWLTNRIAYFNGKYLSKLFRDDKYTMRLYTPDPSGENYYHVYNVTEEQFNSNTYYTRTEEPPYIFTEATVYDANAIYYMKADERLTQSLQIVPPNNNYTLTPLHNAYLSVAFGGSNGQLSGPHYAIANAPYLVSAPAAAKYNDTETYVYGASQLKDLGDLSTQYLGLFSFPGETKLENLILGNKTNGYYNPNFSALSIGNAAPQLKKIDISNTQLTSILDLRGCQNIREIQACGSGITGVSLPSYGVLEELRLPTTITSLVLDNQTHLLNNNFTLGTYDSETDTYTDANNLNLQIISIEGMPQFNSYPLVKLSCGTLQGYCFRDINWTINNAEIQDTSDNLKGIRPLETLLNRKAQPQYKGSATSTARALTGTIAFATDVDAVDSLKIYEHYSTIFPDLIFQFDESQIKHINLYDGDGNIYWSKPISINSQLTEDFYDSSSYGAFSVPIKTSTQQYQYTFENKWLTDPTDPTTEITGQIPLISGVITTDINFYPVFTQTIQTYTITYHINDEIETFTVDYGTPLIDTLPKRIPFSSRNNPISSTNRWAYPFLGYSENGPTAVDNLVDFTNNTVNSSRAFYAVFGTQQYEVTDPIHVFYPAWNIASTNQNYNDTRSIYGGLTLNSGNTNNNVSNYYTISFKEDWTYDNFVTIPAVTNDTTPQPITVLASNNQITANNLIKRVYCAAPSQLKVIANGCFQNCTSLVYFDFPASLRQIGSYAFQLTNLENNTLGGSGVIYIGQYAFNQSLNGTSIKIPGNVEVIDGFAAAYCSGLTNWSLQIGDASTPSILNFNKYSTNDANRRIIAQNEGHSPTAVTIYTNQNYSEEEQTLIGNLKLYQHLFGDTNLSNTTWNFIT